jgi:hypothetical protein
MPELLIFKAEQIPRARVHRTVGRKGTIAWLGGVPQEAWKTRVVTEKKRVRRLLRDLATKIRLTDVRIAEHEH